MNRSNETVTLNIRGKKFCLLWKDIRRNPGALLANLTTSCEHFDHANNEYCFNRNPHVFQFIMDYYIEGELHFPSYLCHSSIKAEMEFWKLNTRVLSRCCRDRFLESEHKITLRNTITKEMNPLWDEIQEHLRRRQKNSEMSQNENQEVKLPVRLKLWLMMEDPNSSRPARVWSIFMFSIIMLSVIVLVLESLPGFREAPPHIWEVYENMTENKVQFLMMQTDVRFDINIAEMVTIIAIALDLIIRYILTPRKKRFWTSFLNIIQFLSLLPSITQVIFVLVGDVTYGNLPRWFLTAAASIRLMRVLLVFRSAKGYRSLKILALSVAASWRELVLMAVLLLISVFVFSFMMFYTEFTYSDNLENIPNAIWLALITMTTVGYGDVAPISVGGKITGGLCAVAGILLIALPVAIIGNNFNQYYNAMASHIRLRTPGPWNNIDEKS